MSKPIKIYGHERGPNPYKVVIILEELKIPYDYEVVPHGANKEEPFISINPNGRVPAIHDPNTDFTLWESGAIIDYLLAQYDTNHTLHSSSLKTRSLQSQWAYFQVSGQGPYFGQKTWFTMFHSEQIPSAIERYAAEIRRVLSVFELHFEKTGQEWLVGDQICYADLMFYTWNELSELFIMGESFKEEWAEKYPKTWAWHRRIAERESVKKMKKLRDEKVEKAAAAKKE